MNVNKEKIIKMITENMELKVYEGEVDKYLLKYPGDTDMLTIKSYIYLVNDNIEEGCNLLKFVLKKCPFSVDALFLLGQAYNEKGNFYDALMSLGKASMISAYLCISGKIKFIFYNDGICSELMKSIIDDTSYAMCNLTKEDLQRTNKLLKDFRKKLAAKFDLFTDILRKSNENIIGNYFSNTINDVRFCGIYDSFDFNFYLQSYPKNLQLYKAEMLKPIESGKDIFLQLDSDSLVPILGKEFQTTLEIEQSKKQTVSIPIDYNMHFNYFKMKKGEIKVHADKELIVAEPVPLLHHKQNKKLVISLFVDGISQKVISEYGLENIMPNTYNFFKKGMICNNAFTSADWTYPSLASLISGLSVPNHMMIHPKINIKFPKEQKLLFEYFKEKGYHTAIISGDWRTSSATYDSIRGVDRYIAQHQNSGYRTENILVDVIDHLETFKDTDQYIWIGTGDLHDIADGFALPSAIQAKMDLEDYYTGKKSETSVKQEYNPNKIKMYVKEATHVDSKLKVLYDYIEEKYKEDEFVVTLFGDHGQAYIVKPEEFHISRGLSNIGFMTRGGGVSGVSDEYINIVDYTNIITKLAGLENINIESDGMLPKTFGGNKENDFAITETIHPGDPYMIAMHGEKYTFYMETSAIVNDCGKVDMSSYNAKLYDYDGNQISDESIINKFIEFVFDRTKYIQIY